MAKRIDGDTEPRIPGFRDLTVIGRGATSVVYRAHDDELNRWVAVKVFRADDPNGPAQRRFFREREITANLGKHPHVVQVLGTGLSSDGLPYVVIELFEQGSVADRIRTQGSFPVDKTIDIGIKIADATDAAHRAGVLHRDIKPQNVLISEYGPALADFGIARSATNLEWSQSLEQLTPMHAAPEILLGGAPTPEADVYSLGSTLYTMLAGRPPFAGPPRESLLTYQLRAVKDPVPPLARPDVPEALSAILTKALAKQPGDRYRTPGELRDALSKVQKSQVEIPSAPAASTSPWAPSAYRRPPSPQAPLAEVPNLDPAAAASAIAASSIKSASAPVDDHSHPVSHRQNAPSPVASPDDQPTIFRRRVGLPDTKMRFVGNGSLAVGHPGNAEPEGSEEPAASATVTRASGAKGPSHQRATVFQGSTSTPRATGPRWTKKRMGAVAALILVLITLVALDLSVSGTAPTHTNSYAFAPESFPSGLIVNRTWVLSGSPEDLLRGSVDLTNGASHTINTQYDEVIPYSVAMTTGAISFSPAPDQIVQSDPIVQYNMDLVPGGSTRIHYDVTISPYHVTASAELSALARDQSIAQADYLKSAGRAAPITLASLSTSSNSILLAVGGTQTIDLSGTMSNGSPATSLELSDVSWSSSDTNIASVNRGLITGNAPGTDTVTAQAGKHSTSVSVTVLPAPTSSSSQSAKGSSGTAPPTKIPAKTTTTTATTKAPSGSATTTTQATKAPPAPAPTTTTTAEEPTTTTTIPWPELPAHTEMNGMSGEPTYSLTDVASSTGPFLEPHQEYQVTCKTTGSGYENPQTGGVSENYWYVMSVNSGFPANMNYFAEAGGFCNQAAGQDCAPGSSDPPVASYIPEC